MFLIQIYFVKQVRIKSKFNVKSFLLLLNYTGEIINGLN